MNSLERIKPNLGRNSSLYFVWIWYKVIGNCFGDLTKSLTKDVNISIENQLYNAYFDNNLNLNQFDTNLTFEQNNPKEFEDYLF